MINEREIGNYSAEKNRQTGSKTDRERDREREKEKDCQTMINVLVMAMG